jgi:hypothetical protein
VGEGRGRHVDQPDDEAWLLELAARIDEGRPIDWARVEAAAGPEALEIVRALRVIETMAIRGREPVVAVQSAAVTESQQQPEDEPQSDRYRSVAPSPPEEIRRKLIFGVALIFALGSVYAGLFEARALQFALAGLALAAVVVALFTGANPPTPPPAPPWDKPGGGTTA